MKATMGPELQAWYDKWIVEWKAQMPTPEEFVRMIHDATCPIEQVGIYSWEEPHVLVCCMGKDGKHSRECDYWTPGEPDSV
jgi:hypothetical protein